MLFQQDKTTDRLIIQRLQCVECHRISYELPDLVVPYKRYESDAVRALMELMDIRAFVRLPLYPLS